MPVPDECLSTAIKDIPGVLANVPGVLANVPAAAEIALESDEDKLAASEDIPTVYNSSPEHQTSLIRRGKLPVFGDKSAAVEDMLASNNTLAMDDDDLPAECDEFPEHESMSVSYKNTPGSRRVVIEELSVLEGLWNLQDGCAMLLASIFRPACRIFAYRKVRKKFHTKTAA